MVNSQPSSLSSLIMNKLYHLLFLLFCVQSQAQTPVFQLHSTQELGDLRLTTVYQDSHGWIWLGAQQGVYRFDGQEFMPMKLPDKMEPSPVTVLFESKARLWVGFRNGMIAFLPDVNSGTPISTGDFAEDLRLAPKLTLWAPEEGLPTASITGFAEDKQGALWISTSGEGLYTWNNGRLYQFNKKDDGLASDDVYALTTDHEGRVWAATDGGISICSMPEKGKKVLQNLGKADGLPDEIITAITTDVQGNIWCGTDEQGVFCYNTANRHVAASTPNWPYGPVTELKVFGNNEVWIGTEKKGIVCYDSSTGTTMNLPSAHQLAASRIHAMCKDREGLLWLVSDHGILYSSNVRFGKLETPFPNIQAICTDQQGRFWVGSSEGLYWKKGRDFIPVLPKKENIVSLWVSPLDGVIWAGSLGNGVFLIRPEGQVLRHLPERETLANGSVLSISGNKERVWLATLDGVSVLNAKTLQPEKGIIQDELGSNYVYKVLTDSRGRVWFGTDGKGLVVYENGAFRVYSDVNGVALRTIYSIAEDRKGNIWFSTARDGLFRFDGQHFERFTTANHLHSMAITGIAADGNNQIVIGYEDGFDLLNPDRLDHINFCWGAEGVPNAEVNLNALWADAQGHVWMGTQNGILKAAAYKDRVMDDPQPSITGVSVFLQPIDFSSNASFVHDQNYFLFNFIGLWYTNPESVRYRYRLDGFDLEWKVTKDHTASYPKLPPGTYTFRVQTSEHGNFDRVPEATWSFRIEKPYWQRWWFFLLLTTFLAGIFVLFVRTREAGLKREALLKREKVESQFETLKSQINPHFLFNSFNTLITIIEENPKLAVEYVEHLSDFYRSIMVYRERDFINLAEEMELVRSFDFLLKKRYEDGFHLIDRVNGQIGQVMPLSLQMLVENAVKHNVISASKPLTVEIFTENGHIVVRNNIQRKIKPEASTHFGLQSLINRYKLLGERPVIVEDNAAFFIVKIPIL